MPTVGERVAALEVLIATVLERLESLESEVTTGEGIAPRLSLRTRMHSIEAERAAASAAQAALSAIKAERRADANMRLTKINVGIAALAIVGAIGNHFHHIL